MKGILYNLLEDVTAAELGEAAWDDLVERAGLGAAYTAVGNYADAEFLMLIAGLPVEAGPDVESRLRWFGEGAMPLLAKRYPMFFGPHTTTASFLGTLNDVVHSEVLKLYHDAAVPTFDIVACPDDLGGGRPSDTGSVVLGYQSTRRLCWLAEGFVVGAARVFGEEVRTHQPQCMMRGDEACSIVCTFGPSS